MKKTILCIALAFSSYASAQVGINTDSPQATLDIAANQDGTIAVPSGLLIPRITRMQAAKVTTSLPLITTPVESTLIYINDISGETYTNGVAMDIDTKGYYFYSAVNQKWTKIANNPDGTSNFNFNFENGLTHTSTGNITNVQLGGELKKPTTITTTTGDNNTINNLAIIGDVKNAFSVDGTTFSVDGATNNVGIGTTSPKNKLHVTSGNLQLEGLLRVGSDNNGLGNPGTLGQVLVSKGTDAPPEWTNIVPPDGGVLNPIIINAINGIDSNDDDNDGIYKVMLGGNPIVQETVLNVSNNPNASLKITGENINDFSVGDTNLSVDNANNRVGIGTKTPDTKLHIDNGAIAGAIKIVDGTQAANRVLTSDADGIGTWQPLPTATPLKALNGISLDVNTNILRLGGNLTKTEDTVITASPYSKLNIAGNVINAFSVGDSNFSVDNVNKRVGIGTIAPTNKLHIDNGTTAGAIRITDGTQANGKVLTSDANGVGTWVSTSKLSIPVPAVFELDSDRDDFLYDTRTGYSDKVKMSNVVNAIEGLSFSQTEDATLITFPPGIYQTSFVYEANYDNMPTGIECTVSSYFVDFPYTGNTTGNPNRVHSTASHNKGSQSNHGGTITFTSKLTRSTTWEIKFGLGQSGNCTVLKDGYNRGIKGLKLERVSTQLTIMRVGDAS